MVRRSSSRRGSIYVLVLGVSLVVSVIGVTAMATARLDQRTRRGSLQSFAAESLAMAGVDYALHTVNDAIDAAAAVDGDWRQGFTHGEVLGPYTLGEGSFSWWLLDEKDDNLRDDATDDVTIVAEGLAGGARFRLSAKLRAGAGTGALPCLDTVMTAGASIAFAGCTLNGEGIVSAGGSISAASSLIRTPVEAAGAIVGGAYTGGTTALAPARMVPTVDALDYYLAQGTLLPLVDSDLDGDVEIDGVLLSPTVNPFGTPNPFGIYIVDCLGGDFDIRNSRIVGTIVAINVGPSGVVTLKKALNWQPAVIGYPALLVDGNIDFNTEREPLYEWGVANFNPPGTPYREVEDNDLLDTYPSFLSGIYYATGSVHLTKSNHGTQRIQGVILAGSAIDTEWDAGFTMFIDDDQLTNPPPGFTTADGRMQLVPGSWTRLVD